MSDLVNSVFSWAQSVMLSLGYPGITLLIALETVFPPMPTELILPLAGSLSAQGRFGWPGLVVAATIGSLMGATLLYGLARWGGEPVVARLLDRYGRYFGLSSADLTSVQRWFDRNGEKMVVLARITPGLRTLISVPAGLALMPLPRFWLYTALGSGLWNSALMLAGRALGENWSQVEAVLGPIGPVVYGVLLLVLMLFVGRRLWRQRQARRPPPGSAAPT